MKKTAIVLTLDDHSFFSCIATLSSIIHSSERGFVDSIFVMHETGMDDAVLSAFKKYCTDSKYSVFLKEISDFNNLKDLFPNDKLCTSFYLSLYIPAIFSDYSKVVYITNSVLVNFNIDQLFDIEIGQACVAGFRPFDLQWHKDSVYFEAPDRYISCSIVIWNVSCLRSENLDFLRTFREQKNQFRLKSFEDLINCAFRGKIFELLSFEWILRSNPSIVSENKIASLVATSKEADSKKSLADLEIMAIQPLELPFSITTDEAIVRQYPFLRDIPVPDPTRNSKNQSLGKIFLSVKNAYFRRYYTFLKKYIQQIYDILFKEHIFYIRNLRDTLLLVNAKRRSEKKFSVEDVNVSGGYVATFERNVLLHGEYGIKHTYFNLFNTRNIINYDTIQSQKISAIFFNVFRNAGIKKQINALLTQSLKGHSIYFVECGLLQSVTNVNESTIPMRFRRVNSYIVDDMGFYFDAYTPSRLENYLNSPDSNLSGKLFERAKRLQTTLFSKKITKYNYQPIFTPEYLQNGRKKILIVDQSKKDASIIRGMADDTTFSNMLESAIAENPDSDIFIKTHPDSIARQRGCYYADIKNQGRIHKITDNINPYSVLEAVDKVYVCSSQLGLEALIAGKEVSVFGMPAYAGWGLTDDRLQLERRKGTHSLEDLIHAFFIQQSVYFHPFTGERCEVEEFIDSLVALRTEYFEMFSDIQWNCAR